MYKTYKINAVWDRSYAFDDYEGETIIINCNLYKYIGKLYGKYLYKPLIK